MAASVQEAVLHGIVLTGGTLLVLSGACRLLKLPSILTAVLAPAAVLGAYGLVYQKIPAFPPIGAVNKVFYIILLGTILGAIFDHFNCPLVARAAAILQPLFSGLFIGLPLLPDGATHVLCASIFGMVFQYLLLPRHSGTPAHDIDVASTVAIGALGFAPLALLGASSSSLQLCLTAAAGIGLPLLLQITSNRYVFGFAGRLGAIGGLLSVVWAVILITGKSDPVAVAILSLVALAPRAGAFLASKLRMTNALLRHGLVGLCALVPAAAAVVTAFTNYPTAFPF